MMKFDINILFIQYQMPLNNVKFNAQSIHKLNNIFINILYFKMNLNILLSKLLKQLLSNHPNPHIKKCSKSALIDLNNGV